MYLSLIAAALLMLSGCWHQVFAGSSSAGATVPPNNSTIARPALWNLVGPQGSPIYPSCIIAGDGNLFLLNGSNVWQVPGGLSRTGKLQAQSLLSIGDKISGMPVQEFNNLVYIAKRRALVVLTKSGDLLEYSTKDRHWQVYRRIKPVSGRPDPDFVDICSLDNSVCLLDPESNQLWSAAQGGQLTPYLKEVLPWRAQQGDQHLFDAMAVTADRDAYILHRSGHISRYAVVAGKGVSKPFIFTRVKNFRPSRIFTANSAALYVVEREHNRIIALDKQNGRSRFYSFPTGSDLRGVLPLTNGFLVINGNTLLSRESAQADKSSIATTTRPLDSRLDGLTLPLTGLKLPGHAGVWPGARRLYRYGVHKGVDFFGDIGCKARVQMNTPVRAADVGKVIRADANFKDMDLKKFNQVMRQCLLEHNTSEANEDLFRGCQVWIDHGNGLITRYAHLNKIKDGLKAGSYVTRGDIIGYVGVSGTGDQLPGRSKHPHLHFEIWLDGYYLGFSLTPSETIGVYEGIFGTTCGRHGL